MTLSFPIWAMMLTIALTLQDAVMSNTHKFNFCSRILSLMHVLASQQDSCPNTNSNLTTHTHTHTHTQREREREREIHTYHKDTAISRFYCTRK
jgi:hypothetical protein